MGFRKMDHFRMLDLEYLLRIIIKVLALFIPEIGRGLPVPNDPYRVLHTDGTMIGCQNYFKVHFR